MIKKAALGPQRHLRRGRARAISQQPRTMRRRRPRSPPRPRATGATRRSKTLHPTNNWECGPRSIELLTVDPRSRRPLTELCCPPVPPWSGACSVWLSEHDAILLTKHDAAAHSPIIKKGARPRRAVFTPAPGPRRNTTTALILFDFRAGVPQHDPPHPPQPMAQQLTEGAAPGLGDVGR